MADATSKSEFDAALKQSNRDRETPSGKRYARQFEDKVFLAVTSKSNADLPQPEPRHGRAARGIQRAAIRARQGKSTLRRLGYEPDPAPEDFLKRSAAKLNRNAQRSRKGKQ
jgi:hypothetical protein